MGYQSLHPQSANPFKCDAKPTHTSQSSQSCAKRCQSITNLMSIQCCPSASAVLPISDPSTVRQSNVKPDPSANTLPIHQFITNAAIHQLSTNPGSTHRPTISCKSSAVAPIQITEDTLIIHFGTQPATACQYRNNPYGHRLALDWQRSCQPTTNRYGQCTLS